MKSGLFATLLSLLAAVICAAQEPTPNPAQFLVRISWSDLDLSVHGISENDCLLVLPDGHFHMEQRRQRLPEPRASLYIHDSVLSNFQLAQLQSLLNQKAIVDLPKFVPFPIPVNVRRRRGFRADISRNQETVQSVGYMEWELSKPNGVSEPAVAIQRSKALAKSQGSAKTALDPLLQWFMGVESQQLHTPDSGKSTFCQLE